MGTYEDRGGRPQKGDCVERYPHFLEDRLLKALFIHHRHLFPRELERRLLPVCLPKPKEVRKVFRERVAPTVICLPDRTGLPLPPMGPRRRAELIIRGAARKYDITQVQLVGPSREKIAIEARREASYLIARDTDLPITVIGRLLNKDHTTVMHAIERYCEIHHVALPREKQERANVSTSLCR